MKCHRCGHDSKYKERDGGVCPKCRGLFAFEPQKGDPFTDVGFAKAIEVVSGAGTVRFEPAHVYYQLNRRVKGGAVLGVTAAVVGVGGLVLSALLVTDGEVAAAGAALTFAVLAALALGFAATRKPRTAQLTTPAFLALWARWQKVHGPPPGLIPPTRRALPARSPELEDELRSYSFDRAVICDSPAVVDVLVANRFHFENNCAILSVGGYPESAFETVRAMLRNNPRLLVLAVHDASPQGCTLAHRLATDPDWFGPGAGADREGRPRVVDVGLRPAHERWFRGLLQENSPPRRVSVQPGITAAEAEWLSRYTLETAAIRPEQLVKRLYKAMLHAEASGADGGGAGGDGGDGWVIFGMDADSSDGGADSFG